MERTTTPDLGAEHINELARTFWYSSILRAGLKLDVFNILEAEGLSADQLATRIGASPTYTKAFLDCCVVLDLLTRDGDRYVNAARTSAFLVKDAPAYVGDHALHHTNTWASWGRLDEAILDGKTLLPFETGYVDAGTYWTDYMMGQHNRATSGQGHYLVENVDLKGRTRMLDLGGGAASYSIALCKANPHLEAVVVDRPEPLEIARALVAEQGLQDRISFIEGSFFDADLGSSGYDVALISGVVLITPEEDCRRLIKLAYNVLKPGGMIIVQDYMRLEHSPERERLDTLENLYVMLVFNSGAGDREGEEVVSWLKGAGFREAKMVPLPTQLGLVLAEKPA